MPSNRIISSYDKSADVLYVRIAPVENVRNIVRDDGLILRYDRASKMPVGATIIDYKEHWSSKRLQLARELADFLGVTPLEVQNAMPKSV